MDLPVLTFFSDAKENESATNKALFFATAIAMDDLDLHEKLFQEIHRDKDT